MNDLGLHFANSNLDEYDIDRDKHADKSDSGKDKCVCSIDIISGTKKSNNVHEEYISL